MFDFMIDSLQLCKTLSILYEMSFDNNKRLRPQCVGRDYRND